MNEIETYLNLPSTHTILNTPPNQTFHLSSTSLFNAFEKDMDVARDRTEFYLAQLLHRGVKVLLYAGTTDLFCNWVGNLEMLDGLEWDGREGWKEAEWRDWGTRRVGFAVNEVGGLVEADYDGGTRMGSGSGGVKVKRSGRAKTFGNLTLLTVENAGHMVPYDKPQEALFMLNEWLYGRI